MKYPHGAISKDVCKTLPKTTTVYWCERPSGKDEYEVCSKTILWFDVSDSEEYHVNFAYPVHFFLNYWDAYAHATRVNAKIDGPWVSRRLRQS